VKHPSCVDCSRISSTRSFIAMHIFRYGISMVCVPHGEILVPSTIYHISMLLLIVCDNSISILADILVKVPDPGTERPVFPMGKPRESSRCGSRRNRENRGCRRP